MKNRTSGSRLPFIFPYRIHGKVTNKTPILIKSPLKKTKTEIETILRWEDDGGQILNAVDPSKLDVAKKTADK